MIINMVVGASGGIGSAILKSLQEKTKYDECWATSRQPFKLKTDLDNCKIKKLDVTDEQCWKKIRSELQDVDASIQCLVLAQGVGYFGSIQTLTLEQFQEMLDVNLTGAFLAAKYLGDLMCENGSVIILGSALGVWDLYSLEKYKPASGYAASKHGLSAFTKIWDFEAREYSVTILQLGATSSSFSLETRASTDKGRKINPTDVGDFVAYLGNISYKMRMREVRLLPQNWN